MTTNGTGARYFRLVTYWDSNNGEWSPSSSTNDYLVTPGVEVPASEIVSSTGKAYYINFPNSSYNYIFKTKAGGNPPDPRGLIVFEVQGTVRSVSSVSQDLSTIYPGQAVVVTATLDGALSGGQGVYLRYTNDAFSTSTVVQMTGSGTSYSATIPSGVNSSSKTVTYYVFTSGSGLTISGSNADFYTINMNTNGGSNYSYTVKSTWITAADGNWSNTATWLGGVVPPDNQPVTIDHAVTLDQNATVSSCTINSSKSLTSQSSTARTLTISSDGTFTNNGTFTANNGKVLFSGSGTINGTTETSFNNVDLNGATTFSTTPSFNYLLLYSGYSISGNSPNFPSNSKLEYSTGISTNRGLEWTDASSGAGFPSMVVISAGTTLNMGTTVAYCGGTLQVGEGSSLNTTSNILTVGGDVIVDGTISLGGDMKVKGNWKIGSAATQSNNNKAVFFTGTVDQTITKLGGGTVYFDYLILDKPSGNLILSSSPATDVVINTTTGEILQLNNSGPLDLNGRSLTLNNNGGNISVNDPRNVNSTVSGGSLVISGSKSVTGSGTLTLGSNVTVKLANGINFGASKTTLNGTLQINAIGFVDVNAPIYGTGSLLQYNSGANPYDRKIEWNPGATSGPGYPYHVRVSSNTTLNVGGTVLPVAALNMGGDLTIDAGSGFYMDYGTADLSVPVVVAGNLIINGNLSLSGNYSGDLKLAGHWTRSATGVFSPNDRAVFFNGSASQTISANGGETFDYVIIDKSANNVTLTDDILINKKLTLTKGLITTGVKKVTLAEGANAIANASSNSYIDGILVQTYSSLGTKVFPIGKGGHYRPLTFNYLSLTGISAILVEQIEASLPGTIPQCKSLLEPRHWTISQSGGSSFTYKVTLDSDGYSSTEPALMLKNENNVNTVYPVTAPYFTNATVFNSLIGTNAFALITNSVEVFSIEDTICYSNLKAAFDAINNGGHTGSIVIKIHGSTFEMATATLNESGSGSASYSSVTIFPTATGLTVQGNLNDTLIKFNGSDQVMLDGRVNQSGSADLTISNTSTGSGASTILFINDATGNTVRYCKIRGATTNTGGGVVHFSTADAGNGNDDNVIEYNDISGLGADRPVNAIYSAGTESQENSGNVIRSNSIHDFFHPSINSGGITISSDNTAWTIEGNSFYETDTLSATEDVDYHAIKINNSGGSYLIDGNYIGGSDSICAGRFVKSGEKNNPFTGIWLQANNGTIRRNIIRSISWTNSATSDWKAIYVYNGTVTIGGQNASEGNQIGDSDGTGSIVFTAGSSDSKWIGIERYSDFNDDFESRVAIMNNSIGSVETANSDIQSNTSFYGVLNFTIYDLYDTIDQNLIGSRTQINSIFASSPCQSSSNHQEMYGIYNDGAGQISVRGNIISNFKNNAGVESFPNYSMINGIYSTDGGLSVIGNTVSSLTNAGGNYDDDHSAIVGINIVASYSATVIKENQVYNFICTGTDGSSSIVGLFYYSEPSYHVPCIMEKNFIHSLSVASPVLNSRIIGIKIEGYAISVYNNIISISDAISGAENYGLYLTSSGHTIQYNTVNLNGNNSGRRNAALKIFDFDKGSIKNNILSNLKPVSDYNYSVHHDTYFVVDSLFEYNDYCGKNLNIGPSPHSLYEDPKFQTPGGTEPIDYKPLADDLLGDILVPVTKDFFDSTRCFPTMGAIEVPTPPDTTGPIAGFDTVCPNTDSLVYTIPSVPYAIEYIWKVPTGWSINVTGDTTIMATAGPAGSSGYISVFARNNCGDGEADSILVRVEPSTPEFTVPSPWTFCVRNIETAWFYPDTMDIQPIRPDYYLVSAGDTVFDLDATSFSDNCCSSGPFTIQWEILLQGGGTISGSGQPSDYGADIELPGDSLTYNDKIHTIRYRITNCDGASSEWMPVSITIKPRPNVIKDP